MVSSRKAVGAQNGSIFGVKAPGGEDGAKAAGGKANAKTKSSSKKKPEKEKEDPVPTLEEVGWVMFLVYCWFI
jgi:hypothetical protein